MKFALGFVLGAVAGLALAVFTSPADQSGAAKAVADEFSSLYSRGKRVVDDARAQIDDAVDTGKAAAEEQRLTLQAQWK